VALLTVSRGRQHLGALFNLVAYYVLALPVGLTLAFHPRTHLGLQGLWVGTYSLQIIECSLFTKFLRLGQVLGLFIVGLGEYGVVWLATDWDKEVQRSKDRNLLEAKQQGLHLRNEDNVG
jgi:MATE family multidrug resistance protein